MTPSFQDCTDVYIVYQQAPKSSLRSDPADLPGARRDGELHPGRGAALPPRKAGAAMVDMRSAREG